MSKRKTVKLNLDFVNPRIKEICRSNVVFCEKMGRSNQKTWVTDWNRVDSAGHWTPKNLPSPEEAAQMCLLLHTTPEEILLGVGETEEETAKLQADIALVRQLVEQKSDKKAPDQQAGSSKEALLNFVRNTDDRAALLAVLDEVNRKLQEMK
nr:MAG TPA: hypothetical protein [Caudoviricetes sp.]